MTRRLIRLRKFLNKNKIFFEIFLFSILSFTGIFVAIQANIISENQTKIMKLENTPQIEIRAEQLLNKKLNIYDVTKWYVFNHNSKISNLNIKKELSFIKLDIKDNYETKFIPLRNYLDLGGTIYGDSEGLIYDFDNKYCGYDEYLTRKKIWDYGYLTVNSYVQISFNDVLKNNDEKYFQIEPSINEINKKDWDSLSTIWDNNSKDAFFLSDDINDNVQQIKGIIKRIK